MIGSERWYYSKRGDMDMAVVKEQELTSFYIGIAEALGAPSDEAEVFARCR